MANPRISPPVDRPLIATIESPNGQREQRELLSIKTENTEYAVGRGVGPTARLPHIDQFSVVKVGNKVHAKGTAFGRLGLKDGEAMTTSALKSLHFESGQPLHLDKAAGFKIGFSYGAPSKPQASPTLAHRASVTLPHDRAISDPAEAKVSSAFRRAFKIG